VGDRVSLDIVICTYNNASSLDRVLEALTEQQEPEAMEWGVLVVENNCADHTSDVLAAHGRAGILPLRVVHEPRQGLTPARVRGVAETTGEWIAFVDDDCLVAPNWIAQLAEIIAEHPGAGAIGGEVTLDWEAEPASFVRSRGWAYAQQGGSVAESRASLVGAGMVVRRRALEETGWTQQPYLADRVAGKLVSGGDVEIALRLGAAHELWFDTRLRLRHAIPSRRTSFRHLIKLVHGLGVSQLFGDSLVWSGSYRQWLLRSLRRTVPFAGQIAAAVRLGRAHDAVLSAAFLTGWLRGVLRLLRNSSGTRDALLGCAASSEDGRVSGSLERPRSQGKDATRAPGQ
jgi:glycosyltransferase involved in cell wall biosynthesis